MKGILLLLFIGTSGRPAPADEISWRKVDTGLLLAEYYPQKKSSLGDSRITILKIDPAFYSFELVQSRETMDARHTAGDWCHEKKLIAAINAGMYQADGSNVGYMKNGKSVNNARFNSSYNNILAFNCTGNSVPEVQIIDLKCQHWDSLKDKYSSFSQSLRMIDCERKNTWSQQARKWSTVVWGMDSRGNALWIFCRSPYSMHDFIDILLKAPLDLQRLMYLEGGPEASLYLDHKGVTLDLYGSYETGFREDDMNAQAWEIPNVIGIKKKP